MLLNLYNFCVLYNIVPSQFDFKNKYSFLISQKAEPLRDYSSYSMSLHTSDGKFLTLEELCSRDISPEAARTNGSEMNDWYGYV